CAGRGARAGHGAGARNTTIGGNGNVGSDGLDHATAVGAGPVVSSSNTVVLGRGADIVQVPGNLNVIGTLTGSLPSGSANYVQNTTTQQASSNFNISDNGTAGGTLSGNTMNAATQYNIAGIRVLGAAGYNLFAGFGAGRVGNSTWTNITLIGSFANVGNDGLEHATAVGAGAIVSSSDTVVLGRGNDTVQVPGSLAVNGGTLSGSTVNGVTQYNLSGQ